MAKINVVQEGERWRVGTNVIIDVGPELKVAVATPELLDDSVTADHYQVGRLDALGAVIALEQPITYLDWKATHGFYVYAWQMDPTHPAGGFYEEKGYYADYDSALAFAKTIAV